MTMRQLTSLERNRLKALTDKSIEFTLIQPTKTGLNKCILDATGPVRNYFHDKGLHDYAGQAKGLDSRQRVDAMLLREDAASPSTASLYRPHTKKGDPRVWFSELRQFAAPDDILALIVDGKAIQVLNVTQTNIIKFSETQTGPIGELIARLGSAAASVSEELLGKLRAIAGKGPLSSVMGQRADTAIGRTIEAALSINMNSRREPDYKGIELKSSRGSASGNRRTLFAKVPDWPISRLKSSSAILDAFGYETPMGRKLNCTVSARAPNPQSLYLQLDRSQDRLDERSSQRRPSHVASWGMETLRAALLEKHNETFWITADCQVTDDKESFQLRSVCHTRAPLIPEFELLIEQGEITVDHLIKRSLRGRVSERGPLFKVSPRSFALLFPPSKTYNLT